MDILNQLAEEFGIRNTQVENTVKLIDDGNTIPFISRYRKEATGGLDDQLLRELSERLTYLRNLESRKEEVRNLIENGGNLTEKIESDLVNAKTLAEVEDIYRPFKPKRKTRAGIAKEKGLQPLADFILAQTLASPTAEAQKYINEEKGVETADDAINGALDIISEIISDDADLRKSCTPSTQVMRLLCQRLLMKRLKRYIKITMTTASLHAKYLRTDFLHLTEASVKRRSRSALSRMSSGL